MSDERGPMAVRGHRPGARGDRSTGRLLEGLVHTMVEMEAGRRPIHSLDPHASPLAARRIRRIVMTARVEGAGRPRPPRGCTPPVRVRTVSAFHPTAGVTEGVVLVRSDERTRAYCIRLEQRGQQWRIVELAPPDTSLRPAVTPTSRAGRLISDEPHADRGRGRGRTREGADGVTDGSDAYRDDEDGGSAARPVH